MFENMLDDPQSAATLFEMVEPSLPQPTAVMREFTPIPGLPRWTLRTEAGTFRLKMAADVGTAAQLTRGAGMLEALRAFAPRGGVPRVPLPRRLELHLSETDLSVAIEERLGTGDARAAWPTLSTRARCAVAKASAEMLLLLHAVPVSDVPVLRTAGTGWAEFRRAAESASYEYRAPAPGEAVPGSVPLEPVSPEPVPPTQVGATPRSEPTGSAPPGADRRGPERSRSERPARPWREVVLGRIERRVAALRGDGVLGSDLLTRVETRLRTAADALPADLERRPCHGAFGIESVAISRRRARWR